MLLTDFFIHCFLIESEPTSSEMAQAKMSGVLGSMPIYSYFEDIKQPMGISGACSFISSSPDPNNHTETILNTTPLGQWLRLLSS